MINKQEIMDLTREFSLEAKTVEKDYVLGWLLAGIEKQENLFKNWIFKGGTCLKKCYFETYRFSEDLDYTLIDEKHLDEKFLTDNFKQIANWIYDEVGIEIPEETIRFEIYQNNAGKTSVEGRIGYVGPLQRRNSIARIKLDLTADEVLVLSPVLRGVNHPYSDNPQNGIHASCYNFTEIFGEKIRALSERARPRDLYDVIHLFRHADPGGKPTDAMEVLKKKCDYKNIPVPDMNQLEKHAKLNELENEWQNMLAHQLPVLPSREQFWKDLPALFAWLHGDSKKLVKEKVPAIEDEINEAWTPSSMIQAWKMPIPFELIRFAGANHLCVEIEYLDAKKLIEPYDVKRTKDGEMVLIAIDHHSGQLQSYHVKNINKVTVTQVSFEPRYLISLTPFIG